MLTAAVSGLPSLVAYDDHTISRSSLTSVALMVVDPASMPRKCGPCAPSSVPMCTCSRWWRLLNASRSASVGNSGGMVGVLAGRFFRSSRLFRISAQVRASKCWPSSSWSGSPASSAEPNATYRCASVGTMNSSTLPSSARWNASRSSDMKNSGPPRKMTVPWIGRPDARPAMVCVATAVKMDAARSGLAAPSLMSG